MTYFNFKHTRAFTMIELVLVIVVMGILAALAIPRLDRDLEQEAADNVLTAIRYTQHMALMDDKHKFDEARWHRTFWHIYFGTCDSKPFYAIGSKSAANIANSSVNVSFEEALVDPANGKQMWANNGNPCSGNHHTMAEISPDVLIGKKYDISSITGTGGCNGITYVGFDHLGRPHTVFSGSTKPDYSSYMSTQCQLNFTLTDGTTFMIRIEPETGYAYIDGQDDS